MEQKTLKDEDEALELVIFQVPECYVYLIPPRKSAASYRADEWDVNKWVWEGILKVISKGEECIIRLEEKNTGELYARAFLREGEPHPAESVIDSSRYFVLRVEENIEGNELIEISKNKEGNLQDGVVLIAVWAISTCHRMCFKFKGFIDGRLRHAFIGLGFRERTEAYDFQAALHDHMKYLDKKKTAEEMEQKFQQTSSVDYSLKQGETLVLQLKSKNSDGVKSRPSDQGLSNSPTGKKSHQIESLNCIKPLPPPPRPLSPTTSVMQSSSSPTNLALDVAPKLPESGADDLKETNAIANQSTQDVPDDDFGDFQAAV